MTRERIAVFLMLSLGGACGGRVSHAPHPVELASAGAGASAGGAAGNAAVAGTGASGGVDAGVDAGLDAGAGGSAGMPAGCSLAPVPLACDAASGSFYFDPASGHCTQFEAGQCAGNDDQFGSLADCQKACHPDMFRCETAGDCRLGSTGCCGTGSCAGPLDLSAYIAVNHQLIEPQAQEMCPSPHYCGGQPTLGPLAYTCQYAFATCQAGACKVVDLRDTELTTCAVDADCTLRVGSQCCPGACDEALIAINSETAFDALVCANAPPCPARCAPPTGYIAVCRAGRCSPAAAP